MEYKELIVAFTILSIELWCLAGFFVYVGSLFDIGDNPEAQAFIYSLIMIASFPAAFFALAAYLLSRK